MKIQLQDETEEKDRIQQKNLQLEAELKTIKKLERSVQKIDRSKKKLEEEFRVYKVQNVVFVAWYHIKFRLHGCSVCRACTMLNKSS